MPNQEMHWKTVTRSQFQWEMEALDFVLDRFPAQDHCRGWANFEFIAGDGSINDAGHFVAFYAHLHFPRRLNLATPWPEFGGGPTISGNL